MIDLVSLVPVIFLVFSLPPIKKKLFPGVDVEKFAYGAVTCGILLTFYGIWIGLAAFDTADIGASIPLLLEGLKTAFGSSLVGLGTSLLINLFFVSSEQQDEKSLKEIAKKLNDLNKRLETFTTNSAEANIDALMAAMRTMTQELEMGINTETAESMERFRDSTEVLYNWQRKYMEEIKSVTEAMDKNAIVTQATSDQLDRTNAVLAELAPVTEQIAESIEWVQTQLPAARRRMRRMPEGNEDGEK